MKLVEELHNIAIENFKKTTNVNPEEVERIYAALVNLLKGIYAKKVEPRDWRDLDVDLVHWIAPGLKIGDEKVDKEVNYAFSQSPATVVCLAQKFRSEGLKVEYTIEGGKTPSFVVKLPEPPQLLAEWLEKTGNNQ